ncbi:MAG TPA: hypothetical protein VFA63_16875 [Pseudonocardiaceae bacterium]|nr:hypothetical protein [Pseudonocardiaceae bacterium]
MSSTDTTSTSLSRTRFVVIACLAAWFVAAFGVSLFGLLRAGPSDLPIPIGVALLAPLLLGVLAYLRSSQFRRLLLRADLRWLIGVQLWRVAGAEFLIYYAHDRLPASFAIPAGVGDVLVGLAAPFVAVVAASGTPAARRIVIGWCIVGIADLVVAVTMGVLNAPGQFGLLAGAITTAPMLELPLSLIPAFFVPLSILLHLIVLRRSAEIGQTRGVPARPGLGGAMPTMPQGL